MQPFALCKLSYAHLRWNRYDFIHLDDLLLIVVLVGRISSILSKGGLLFSHHRYKLFILIFHQIVESFTGLLSQTLLLSLFRTFRGVSLN